METTAARRLVSNNAKENGSLLIIAFLWVNAVRIFRKGARNVILGFYHDHMLSCSHV
jgi:hypothetical protein